MRKALDNLPDHLKQEVSGNRLGVHVFNNGGLFTGLLVDEKGTAPGNNLAEGIHPLVRVVPETGEKALYINLDRMSGVVGLEQEKAVALLKELQEHAEKSVP